MVILGVSRKGPKTAIFRPFWGGPKTLNFGHFLPPWLGSVEWNLFIQITMQIKFIIYLYKNKNKFINLWKNVKKPEKWPFCRGLMGTRRLAKQAKIDFFRPYGVDHLFWQKPKKRTFSGGPKNPKKRCFFTFFDFFREFNKFLFINCDRRKLQSRYQIRN